MSAASDFARLQRLPPAEAMAFMDGRQLTADTYHWHDLWRDEHQRAFTVSRLARGDLLEALQASLAKSVAGDLSRRDWIKSTEQLLKNAGWWGTTEVTDPRTGEVYQPGESYASKHGGAPGGGLGAPAPHRRGRARACATAQGRGPSRRSGGSPPRRAAGTRRRYAQGGRHQYLFRYRKLKFQHCSHSSELQLQRYHHQ